MYNKNHDQCRMCYHSELRRYREKPMLMMCRRCWWIWRFATSNQKYLRSVITIKMSHELVTKELKAKLCAERKKNKKLRAENKEMWEKAETHPCCKHVHKKT